MTQGVETLSSIHSTGAFQKKWLEVQLRMRDENKIKNGRLGHRGFVAK
jgi:hypothetical protein